MNQIRLSFMARKEKILARFPKDRPLDADMGLWWVLHTKPNCERMVAAYLLNRGVGYYLPLFQKRSKYGNLGRIRTTESPLFNGYLCFALHREDHHLLYGSKKFVRILKVENQERFVTELQAVANAVESEQELLVQPGLVPGKRVLIRSGPLEGTEGVVVTRRGEKQLALSVKMFNQTVMVRIDPLTEVEIL
jgi:transcription antitermination factor NusG